MNKAGKFWWELYQIAGARLLIPDMMTPGQKNRVTELILCALAEPKRYGPKTLRRLYRLAMET